MSDQSLRVVEAQANGNKSQPLRASKRVRYVRRIDRIPQIPPDVAARLGPVAERYVFREPYWIFMFFLEKRLCNNDITRTKRTS